MPELWLNYGRTDVILDLKVENLSLIENSQFEILSNESLDQQIESIPIAENTTLVPLDTSNSTVQIISKLVSLAGSKSVKLSIESSVRIQKILSNKIRSQNIGLFEKNYGNSLNSTKEKDTIFVSKANVDPFFGYSGTPTNLLREFEQEKMNEAFHSRQDDLPHPGEKGPPYEIAEMFSKNMEAKAIEIISNNYGINNLFYGDIIQSHQCAIENLNQLAIRNPQELKSLIIGTNIDTNSSLTLSTTLDQLWNSIRVLKKNGIVVLISENAKGFGSRGIEKFAYGEIKLEDYKESIYVDGMEHIMFIHELKEKYNMAILSSLPKYYLKDIFGFKRFSNIQEAVENILDINGKSHRISIIQDPNVAIFKNDD